MAIIADREKLVVRWEAGSLDTRLFRLATDPREQHPQPLGDSTLWESYVSWDSEQTALADAHRSSPGHDQPPVLDTESEARLRALGYVE